MQMYKYSVAEATRFRKQDSRCGNQVKTVIIRNLTALFQRVNYHARKYRHAREIIAKEDERYCKTYQIRLRQPNEVSHGTPHHFGTLYQPVRKELECILFNEQQDGGPGKPRAVISNRIGDLTSLHFYNPLIEPLCYPIIFPYGNTGFYRGEYLLDHNYCEGEDSSIPEGLDRELFEDPLPVIYEEDEMKESEEMLVNYTNAQKNYISLKMPGYEELRVDEDFGECAEFLFPGSTRNNRSASIDPITGQEESVDIVPPIVNEIDDNVEWIDNVESGLDMREECESDSDHLSLPDQPCTSGNACCLFFSL